MSYMRVQQSRSDYVQPCCTYITTEITDMILKSGEKVLLKKNPEIQVCVTNL